MTSWIALLKCAHSFAPQISNVSVLHHVAVRDLSSNQVEDGPRAPESHLFLKSLENCLEF